MSRDLLLTGRPYIAYLTLEVRDECVLSVWK